MMPDKPDDFWRWVAAAAAGLVLAGVFAAPVLSHDWYPLKCCSNQDCWEAGDDEVTPTEGGWRIESSGEVVPYDDPRVKVTPPEGGGRFHVCHLAADPANRALCLFVPGFGS